MAQFHQHPKILHGKAHLIPRMKKGRITKTHKLIMQNKLGGVEESK